MTPLERYLHRATRGLWGKKRLEVKAELRGSVEARAWQLECRGIAPERALEMALAELGAPGAIAAGLTGVHTMPRVFKNTVALGLIAAISLSAFNQSRAQIEALSLDWLQIGSPTRETTVGTKVQFKVYYLKFSSIKRNLEAAGISVDDTPQTVQGAKSDRTVATLQFTLPGSTKPIILQSPGTIMETAAGTLQSLSDKNEQLTASGRFQTERIDLDNSDAYISFSAFVRQLQRGGLPFQLVGWHNPKLVIGSTTLQIGTDKQPVQPWEVYTSIVGRATKLSTWFSSNAYRHAVRVNAPAGSVYAMVSTTQGASLPHVDVARVSDDGVLYFNAAHRVLEFSSLAELKLDFANVRKPGYGDSSRPAKAVLIRITPDLETSFVFPERRRSGALR
jgi:hypothetical protein